MERLVAKFVVYLYFIYAILPAIVLEVPCNSTLHTVLVRFFNNFTLLVYGLLGSAA